MFLKEHERLLLTSDLKKHEGVMLFAYSDTVGKTTIGYGRNIDGVGGKGISLEEAEYLLENDVEEFITGVEEALPWALGETSARKRVLVNMAFNLGVEGLLGFSNMLEAMEDGDYETASKEMLNSKWATQVGKRAVELAADMEHG